VTFEIRILGFSGFNEILLAPRQAHTFCAITGFLYLSPRFGGSCMDSSLRLTFSKAHKSAAKHMLSRNSAKSLPSN